MAYSYDDFTSAATNAGLLDKFTSADLETAKRSPEFGLSILSLMQQEGSATTTEQKLLAQEAANQLRKSYGSYVQNADGSTSFAGTVSGNVSDLTDKINNYGKFEYVNQTDYEKILSALTNPQGFQYDYEKDPQYEAYKKAFLRERQRAVADTMAQYSTATGGRPSSYAVTAAQQAGNYYNAQLGDIIPTLYQKAYQRQLESLGALQSDREFNYQDYLNGFNMLQTSLGNYLNLDKTEYERYLDMINITEQKRQQQYNEALSLYQLLGYATPEVAAILGIPAGSSKGSSSGGSYVNTGYVAKADPTVSYVQSALNELNGAGLAVDGIYGNNTAAAIRAYFGEALSVEDAYARLKGNSVPDDLEVSNEDTGNGGGKVNQAIIDHVNNSLTGEEAEEYLSNLIDNGIITEEQAVEVLVNAGNFNDGFAKAEYQRDEKGKKVYTVGNRTVTVYPGYNPYTNTYNPDAKNGTFSNGYQPDNVNGSKLSKSGKTTVVNGVTQNVWKDKKGKLWVWQGTENKYVPYTS